MIMTLLLILHLPAHVSASETLRDIFDRLGAQRHPSWQCEETIEGEPFIYYNPYRYYRDHNVVFTPSVCNNKIIFTPRSYPGASNFFPTEINHHIQHLCALLMKNYLTEGGSIEIIA